MASKKGHTYQSWIMLLVLLPCQPVVCERETLLAFNGRKGFPSNSEEILDVDNNAKAPEVDLVQGYPVIRVSTMPDFRDSKAYKTREENYLYLPHINNPIGTTMVHLQYTFNHNEPCVQRQHLQCSDHLTLLLVACIQSQNISTINISEKPLFNTTLKSSTTTDMSEEHQIPIPLNTEGYRLVVKDEGSEFLLKSLRLDRYYCQYRTSRYRLPITCPDTPANEWTSTTVQCNCSDPNSAPNNTRLSISEQCVYNPATETATFQRSPTDLFTRCDCKPGYEYTKAPNETRYCKVIPATTTPATTTPTTITPPATATTTIAPDISSNTSVLPQTSANQKSSPARKSTTKPSIVIPRILGVIINALRRKGSQISGSDSILPIDEKESADSGGELVFTNWKLLGALMWASYLLADWL